MRSKASISAISLTSALSLILALTACSKAETAADSGVRRTTTTHELNVGGIITSRDETVTEEPVGTAEANNEVEASVQPGSLTAADYDDNLNPDLYAAYASKALQSGVQGDLPLSIPARALHLGSSMPPAIRFRMPASTWRARTGRSHSFPPRTGQRHSILSSMESTRARRSR